MNRYDKVIRMCTKRVLFLMLLFFSVLPALAEAAHVLLIYDSSKPQISFVAGDIRKALAQPLCLAMFRGT